MQSLSMMRLIICFVNLALGACVYVNPVTAIQLASFNPLSADPADIAVQIDLPEGVGIEDGSAGLVIDATHRERGGWSGFYGLEELPGGIWQIEPEAQIRLRRDQAQILAWEAADPDGTSGSLTARFDPCTIGDGPSEDARVSMLMQVDAGGFLPLLPNAPISQLFNEAEVEGLPPCA